PYIHLPYHHTFPTRRSSDLVMVFSKSQIDAYNAAHPGHNVRVYVVEDDDTACQIKTSADAWKKALDAVDGANQLLTAGKDTTSRDRKSTRLNSSHQIISYAV